MVGFLEVAPYFFFSSIKFHTKPLMSSLPKLATNLSIGNIWKYGVQSINQSFILTRYVKELKKSFKMRACKLLHDLKKLFILMFFFFNYFFFHPLNNIVVSAYSVLIDLLDNSSFNILLPTFVANITFAHDSFQHETFLTLWSKITYNLRYVHFYMPWKP